MGHLIRCLALAKMLEGHFNISFLLSNLEQQIDYLVISEGFKCNFLDSNLKNEKKLLGEADVIVLDGYDFKPGYQQEIKAQGKKLVCIDDIHSFHFYADVIINVSDSVSEKNYSAEPYTRYFLGSSYVLLREPFLISSRKPIRKIRSVDQVFLSMGGADSGNISLKVLQAIRKITSIKKIHVVIGAVNVHEQRLQRYVNESLFSAEVIMHKNINASELDLVISNCQLAICPASGTCMESAAVGIGIISGFTADNQLSILNGLADKRCVLNMGDFKKLSAAEIKNSVERYIENIDLLNEMIKNQKKLIDGLSPARFISIFSELCK
jgi:UDP-2,4-diacetamido-2,4,6-trideoxy-beta-L-altropyranose hydrolase